jgi:hypothetical protein
MNEKAINDMVKLHEEAFGERFIQPVSREDVKTINLLIEVISKLGRFDLVRVIEKYKMIADKDFHVQLEKLLASMRNESRVGFKASGKQKVMSFNDFDSTGIILREIYSWNKTEDENGNPAILLNEGDLDSTKKPVIFNKMLSYGDEVSRDDDFDLITAIKNG